MAVEINSKGKILPMKRITDIKISVATLSVVVLILSNYLLLSVTCQDYDDLNTNSNSGSSGPSNNNNNNNSKPALPQFGRASPTGSVANQQASSQESNAQGSKQQQIEKNERVSPISSSSGETNTSELNSDQQQINATSASARPHETVYSDQRFASLFARRNQGKKLRPPPSEPVKAKPTLPSFIKSPPDLAKFQQTTPQPSSLQSNSVLASQRLQQQQRQQTSVNNQRNLNSNLSSAANKNNNVRTAPANNNANSNLKNKPNSNLTNGKAPTPTPVIKPLGNKFPASSADNPTNLIALARKRFLANSALQNSAASKARPPVSQSTSVQQ